MMTFICDQVSRIVRLALWLGFAAMITTVALQVLARNIIHAPMIWTSDVAQLLFTWLIFIGAAIGLRTGAHYRVNLIPSEHHWLNATADIICLVGGVLVAYMLLHFGWELAMVRKTATIQSLGISRFWMFLAMPVSGGLMLLFLAEGLIHSVMTRKLELIQ